MLFKFSAERYARALLERGFMHLKLASYYARCADDGSGRADRWEGNDAVLQPGRCTVTIAGRPFDLAAESYFYKGGRQVPHIYCMTGVSVALAQRAHEAGRSIIDARAASLGSHCVAMPDATIFMERLGAACERRRLRCEGRLVTYLPVDHNGDIDPFTKSVRYEWQSEYRFNIYGAEGDVLELEIGPLHDVAVMGTTQEVLSSIRFEPTEEPEGDGHAK